MDCIFYKDKEYKQWTSVSPASDMATSDEYFGEAPRPDNQGRLPLCVRSGISKCAVGQFWKKKAVKGKRIDIKQDSVMHALVNIHKVRFSSLFLTFLDPIGSLVSNCKICVCNVYTVSK